MKWSEISLIEYIDTYEMQCDVYVHTKDKRMLVFKDVRTNAHLDEVGFYIDYHFLESDMTAFVPREDFSHMEYRYVPRERITKRDFDELNSFIEEQFEDYEYPAEALTEPENTLFEDLI